eukprot:scaffold262320_cov31-Tisochrysis_lutea.AAC.2
MATSPARWGWQHIGKLCDGRVTSTQICQVWHRVHTGKFLVSNVETLVARAHGAVLIVLKWLMKAVFGIVRSSLRHGHPLRGAPVA